MKKIVTICFCLSLLLAGQVMAQFAAKPVTGPVALQPNWLKNKPTMPSVFHPNAKQYAKSFRTLEGVSYGYIDLDHIEEDPEFNGADLGFPGQINLTERFDTLVGYGTHFTSPYGEGVPCYLDSVTVLISLVNVSPTLDESMNYLKLKAIESMDGYIFYPPATPGGDTLWFPIPNHAVQSSTRAKDSVVIRNLLDFQTPDPENPEYSELTFKFNHKQVTTNRQGNLNLDFYIEIMSAFDEENTDFENQNFFFLKGDRWDYPGAYDFETMRSILVPKSVEYRDKTPETEWWRDLLPYAGITNDNFPDGFYSNFFIIAHVTDQAASVDDAKLEGNELGQNFPNPFNPSTEIRYSLATGGKVTLKITNALGTEVATVVDEVKGAGEHTATFNASELPSGTYFYTLRCGDFTQTKRMVLSK